MRARRSSRTRTRPAAALYLLLAAACAFGCAEPADTALPTAPPVVVQLAPPAATAAPAATPAVPPAQATPAPTAPTPEDDALVRVIDYLPGVSQQLVYATDENVTGRPIYGFTDAYLRYGTVQKLGQAVAALEQLGLTLVIWDAYRPLAAQQALFAAYPDPQYVSDPATGSRTHCRGGAVDVTLADATGALLEMPSGFDDFSERADRDYSDCSAEAAEHACLLQEVMEGCGLVGYSGEWWHFSDGVDYPVEETFAPQAAARYRVGPGEAAALTASPAADTAFAAIAAGEEVRLLARCGAYALVHYQGATGYLPAHRLAPVAEDAGAVPLLWRANCEEYLNLRETPGGEALLGTVRAGEVVELLDWAGRYAQVRHAGQTGYVLSSYLQPADEAYLPAVLDIVKPTASYAYETLLSDAAALASLYPELVEVENIGVSELGREIPVLRLGPSDAAYHVLLQGAIHGREHMTAWLLMALADDWAGRGLPGDGAICWHIVPMANPDGVAISQSGALNEAQLAIYDADVQAGHTTLDVADYAQRWKANGRGTDLNRNFPAGWEPTARRAAPSSERYGGEAPFSAAETEALRAYTLRFPFAATVSYHAYGSLIYAGYGDAQPVNDRSASLAGSISLATGYPPEGGGADGAGYKDWAVAELDIPSVTVEIGCEAAPLAERELYSVFVRNRTVPDAIARWLLA